MRTKKQRDYIASYARGSQNVEEYKKVISTIEDDELLSGINWRPVVVIPNILDVDANNLSSKEEDLIELLIPYIDLAQLTLYRLQLIVDINDSPEDLTKLGVEAEELSSDFFNYMDKIKDIVRSKGKGKAKII